jgi:hypothetical protein
LQRKRDTGEPPCYPSRNIEANGRRKVEGKEANED